MPLARSGTQQQEWGLEDRLTYSFKGEMAVHIEWVRVVPLVELGERKQTKPHLVVEAGAGRVHQQHSNAGVMLLEHVRHAGDGAASAGAAHKRVQPAARLR